MVGFPFASAKPEPPAPLPSPLSSDFLDTMRSAQPKVLLAFYVLIGSLVGVEMGDKPTLFVYTCLRGDWSSAGLEGSSSSDDVTVSISHEAMADWLDLVADLDYAITVTSSEETNIMSSDVICLGTASQESSSVSTLIDGIEHAIFQGIDYVYNVTYVECNSSSEGVTSLPLQLSWTPPPILESSSCISCLALVGVGTTKTRFLRSKSKALCKPDEKCRHYLTKESDSLTSPGFPNRYPDDVDCNFTIIGSPGTSIEIQFQDVRLEPPYSGRCMDYIQVSFRDKTEKPFCGSLTSEELRGYRYHTHSAIAHIRFFTDSKINSNGFRAFYYARGPDACHADFTSILGDLTSYGYPKPYLPNTHCVNHIRLPSSYRVIIKLAFLDLGNGTDAPCSNDVIEIVDVTSPKSVTIVPCSKEKLFYVNQVVFESSSSSVDVRFNSDHLNEGRGFQMFYKGVPSCLNASYAGDSGVLFSPNYPNNYPNNQKCFFMVEVDESDNGTFGIKLTFASMVTESDSKRTPLRNDLCLKDYLEIHSGDQSYRLCGDWSGKEHVIAFPNLAHNVTLIFKSDYQNTAKGFYATWAKVPVSRDEQEGVVCQTRTVSLNASNFEIVHASLSWWDGETDCRSKGGHLAKIDDVITHSFIVSLFADSSSCPSHDSYWIGANDVKWESDFYWSDGVKVKRPNWFPGWSKPQGYNKQPSDDGFAQEDCVEVRRRFHLPWKGTRDVGDYFWNDRLCNVTNPYICRLDQDDTDEIPTAPCNVTIHLPGHKSDDVGSQLPVSEYRMLFSPEHPLYYANFLKCVYKVTSPENTGILIEFDDFRLEDVSDSGQCLYDYLEITPEVNAPVTNNYDIPGERLCGDWSNKNKLLHRVVFQNSVTLTFVTDHSRRYRGFKARLTALNASRLCGDDSSWLVQGKCLSVSAQKASFQEANERCLESEASVNWDDNGETLSVIAKVLWTAGEERNGDEEDSANDRVIFWKPQINASSANCVSVYKPGSKERPDSILGEDLQTCPPLAYFVCSKDTSPYEFEPTTTATTLSQPGDVSLTSLFNWILYPNLATVSITLMSPADHQILVAFYDVDIEYQAECLYDYLQVSNSSLPGRLCGPRDENQNETDSKYHVVSESNETVIDFKSDYSITGKGFNFSWMWLDSTLCHQDIAVPSGETVSFKSFNFPLPYPSLVDCSVTFRSQNSKVTTIVVIFDDLIPVQMADSITYCTDETLGDSKSTGVERSFFNQGQPLTLVSNTAFLRVRYLMQDGLTSGQGFQGHAFSASGQAKAEGAMLELKEDQSVDVYSIGYPQFLPANLQQQVTIRAPIGYNVKVVLEESLGNSGVNNGNCQHYIRFSDVSVRSSSSSKERGKTLDKWCSLTKGQEVTSYLNRLELFLFSGSDQETVFRAHIRASVAKDVEYLKKTREMYGKIFDSCQESPCLFGGKCRQIDDVSSTCDCKPRYGGLLCQEMWCDLEPCGYGWCNMTQNGYKCSCFTNFFGANCDLNPTACSNKMCQGRGYCLLGNTSHPKCKCDATWQGPSCGQMVEEGDLSSTLGQRLLKEPIWIGLIVILSVLVLFGILYIVRRKCGKHFQCCELKKPQVDDNILNADGTITLNSFPLRKMARATMLTPISTSPSPPHTLTAKIEDEGSSATMTPSAKNEGAAARFFASYKDAEKTPIAAPLTTDFSRTTDTSLSQEIDDASVGAMVGGRLQLDLHIRENKAHEESMSRSVSLLDPAASNSRYREKIKRSHSTGPYLVRQATQFDELAVSVSRGLQRAAGLEEAERENRGKEDEGSGDVGEKKRTKNRNQKKLTINDFQHIYPHVIVQKSPQAASSIGDCDVELPPAAASTAILSGRPTALPNGLVAGLAAQTDHTGARVLVVNLDGGDSEGAESVVRSDKCVTPTQLVSSLRSAPSSSRDEARHGRTYLSYEEQFLKEQDKLRRYVSSIREWKDRARLRYKLAKMSSLNSSDEYPRYFFKHHDHRSPSKYSGRPSGKRSHRNRSSVHPLRRTYTADADHVYFSDASKRREQFSRNLGRLTASMEDVEFQRHLRFNSRERKDFSQSSCECPECDFAREQHYHSRSRHRSREDSERGFRGSRIRLHKEKQKHKPPLESHDSSVKHNDFASKYIDSSVKTKKVEGRGSFSSRQRNERPPSHGKHSSRMKSNHECSSTESDVTWKGHSQPSPHNSSLRTNGMRRSATDPSNRHNASSPRSIASLNSHQPLVRNNTPEIVVSETPFVSEDKDLFRKVFSQEVELDDFSPVEEDDDHLVFSSNSNTKESLLGDAAPIQEDNGSAFKEPRGASANESALDCKAAITPFVLNVPTSIHPLSLPASPHGKHKHSRLDFSEQRAMTKAGSDLAIPKTPWIQSTSKNAVADRPGTPTTCNVIVYDSHASGENVRQLHTIKKADRFLDRKHSSLELITNDRLAPPGTAGSLRSVASMHDLSADNPDENYYGKHHPEHTALYQNWCGPNQGSSASSLLRNMDSISNKSLPYSSSSNLNMPHSFRSSSSGICLACVDDDVAETTPSSSADFEMKLASSHDPRKGLHHHGNQDGHVLVFTTESSDKKDADSHSHVSIDDSDNMRTESNNNNPRSHSHLSVTDTDSAMSSVPSPNSPPTSWKTALNFDFAGHESKVKDSAYQTKQGSMEAEAYLEATRARRPIPLGGREEDRKVTQRLHQAAVKLLVMQQRLRRARQNLSRDSAVHTISEDDPSLDEITITSPKSRTFKPGVLYPTQPPSEETFPELPPVHCDRIIEEQDTLTEYEV